MTITETPGRTHPCGCVTVWDTRADIPRYLHACATHRRYAHHWAATHKGANHAN